MKVDFENMLSEVLEHDIDDQEQLMENVRMVERIMAGEFEFKERDRVCLKSKPWQRGSIGAVGNGCYHVHWDEDHPSEVDARDVKRSDR